MELGDMQSEVGAANAGERWQFRFRGSRHWPGVASDRYPG
jgi:hypothetical protein